MESELKLIDEFCMRFEGEWSENQPLNFPFHYFQMESQSFRNPNGVLLELCQIDMQRRWQAWNAKKLDGMCVLQVTDDFAKIPRVKNYLSTASDQGFEFDLQETSELKSCEFVARQKYGDLPSPCEAEPGVRPAPLTILKRPLVSISRSRSKIFRQPIWGQLKVGRRTNGEPEYPKLYERQVPGKLICAEGTDASISRDQFLVSMVSSRYAIVTNTSRNRSFSTDDHRTFKPGASQTLKFPFSVNLGDTTISFERPD